MGNLCARAAREVVTKIYYRPNNPSNGGRTVVIGPAGASSISAFIERHNHNIVYVGEQGDRRHTITMAIVVLAQRYI